MYPEKSSERLSTKPDIIEHFENLMYIHFKKLTYKTKSDLVFLYYLSQVLAFPHVSKRSYPKAATRDIIISV